MVWENHVHVKNAMQDDKHFTRSVFINRAVTNFELLFLSQAFLSEVANGVKQKYHKGTTSSKPEWYTFYFFLYNCCNSQSSCA